MRVKVFGGGAGYGPDGVMTSWAPNSVVEINDDDDDAVAFYGRWVDAGTAELVEPAPAPAPPPATTPATPAAKPAAKATKAAKS